MTISSIRGRWNRETCLRKTCKRGTRSQRCTMRDLTT